MATTAPRADSAFELYGVSFALAPVIVLWDYYGLAGEAHNAVVDLPSGQAPGLGARVLRRLGATDSAHESIRRDLLHLRAPGHPLIRSVDAHSVTLARPLCPMSQPSLGSSEPVALRLSTFYFIFQQLDEAHDFARRVRQRRGGKHPPWTRFQTERWPNDIASFHPRLDPRSRAHGFTTLEAKLAEILERERRLHAQHRERSAS